MPRTGLRISRSTPSVMGSASWWPAGNYLRPRRGARCMRRLRGCLITNSSNPWADLTYKVERSFADGKSKPRAAPAVERAEFKFKGGPGAPPATDDPIISIARAYAKARIANGGQHPPLTDELGQVYRTLLPRAVHAAAALIREQVKRGALLLSSWLKLDIPPRDYVLGHVLCTTSRWLIYGETGVGKTLVGLELAAAAASGKGFLNWPGSGIRRRVMYLDGELPAETFKERMELIAERYGADVGLYGYNRDVLDDGEMPALNTPEGDAWLMREIDSVDPDLIVFDSDYVPAYRLNGGGGKLGARQGDGAQDIKTANCTSVAAPHGTRHIKELRHQDPRVGNGHSREFDEGRSERRAPSDGVQEGATANAEDARAVRVTDDHLWRGRLGDSRRRGQGYSGRQGVIKGGAGATSVRRGVSSAC